MLRSSSECLCLEGRPTIRSAAEADIQTARDPPVNPGRADETIDAGPGLTSAVAAVSRPTSSPAAVMNDHQAKSSASATFAGVYVAAMTIWRRSTPR
jgi:hypothetical protein